MHYEIDSSKNLYFLNIKGAYQIAFAQKNLTSSVIGSPHRRHRWYLSNSVARHRDAAQIFR